MNQDNDHIPMPDERLKYMREQIRIMSPKPSKKQI